MKSQIVPVIHCLDWNQVDKNMDICNRNGIEMVFLINHSSSSNAVTQLQDYFNKAKSNYPNMKIGLNFLQLSSEDSLLTAEQMGNVDAIWSDYPFTGTTNQLYFGAVAFKYQKHVPDYELEDVCKEAIKHMSVVTTSGPGTGKPANINRIKMIREYIGDHKMAIASGITSDNKKDYEPYIDYMLVASSITDGSTELIIEDKLVELINS